MMQSRVQINSTQQDPSYRINSVLCQISTYPGISPHEAVRDGSAQVKADGAEELSLHGQELVALVGVVTDVQEVVDGRRHSLLKPQ